MIPKFRAWLIGQEYMAEIEAIAFRGDGNVDVYTSLSGIDFYTVGEECELIQSTGQRDKNGIEIFEGDVVECKQRNSKRYVAPLCERVGVVVFDKKLLSWVFGKYVFSPMMFEYKVIGNIYENPELLEQQNG